jgi:Na+-transporting NADH:ubiquinone oxidoreductase subunit C
VAISVVKGRADLTRPEGAYQIDGLAGATLTTRGVNNLVQYWLGEEGFQSLIGHLKSGEA